MARFHWRWVALAALVAAGMACDAHNVQVSEDLEPVIWSVLADPPVAQIDQVIIVTTDAQDADSDSLTYSWDWTGKDSSELGTYGDCGPGSNCVGFVGREDRSYTIRGLVDDGNTRVYRDLVVPVVPVLETLEGYAPQSLPGAPWSFALVDGVIEVTDAASDGFGALSLVFIPFAASAELRAVVDARGRVEPGGLDPRIDELIQFSLWVNAENFLVRGVQIPDGADPLTAGSEDRIWEIRITGGRIIAFGEDGESDQSLSLATDRWLRFAILLDLDDEVFAVTVNDVILTRGMDAINPGKTVCDGLVLDAVAPNQDERVYVDNVVFTRNPAFGY